MVGSPAGQLGNFGQAVKYGDHNGNACILGRLYTVFASGAGLANINNFFQSFVVSSTPTTLTYTGATSQDYHDVATLSATLTLSGTSAPVAGQTITFTIGTQSCTGVINTAGAASCILTLNQVPGPYTVTASFAASAALTIFVLVSTSLLFEQVERGFRHPCGLDPCHAAMIDGAFALETRAAFDRLAHDAREGTRRAGGGIVRSPENGDRRHAQCGCDVHCSGIVRQIDTAGRGKLNELGQRGFTGEIP